MAPGLPRCRGAGAFQGWGEREGDCIDVGDGCIEVGAAALCTNCAHKTFQLRFPCLPAPCLQIGADPEQKDIKISPRRSLEALEELGLVLIQVAPSLHSTPTLPTKPLAK